MEKKFVALRVLFAADPASVNLTDLLKMKRFAENNLQELQGWNDGQKLNGDYAIEGWVHYLENVLKDINKELGRRMELVGNPKTTFEELVKIMVEADMAKVAVEKAGEQIRTNLAEYLEKGIVK